MIWLVVPISVIVFLSFHDASIWKKAVPGVKFLELIYVAGFWQVGHGPYSLALITVRHGSADTVVRAMNDFNAKCYFSGSDSSDTF